ncbi:MAG TPA: hypothetical protein VN541_04090, partial [Tepidisphaeraceae bacterium]|nr:hypothetical protein [Tepidisphaeraceae bacterium]
AVQTLKLNDKDREAFLSLMTDVKHAAIERRGARQELADGNDALKAQQTLEAIAHFRTVCMNQYADEQTRKTAQSRLLLLDNNAPGMHSAQPQLAIAPTTRPAVASSDLSPKQRYDLGLSQYRSGDWGNARENLQLAMAAGYSPASIYQDAPAEILKRMDLRDRADRERVQHLMQVSNNATNPAGASGQPDALTALKATAEGEQARHEDAANRAQQWVKEAQDAEKANQYDKALDLYTRAADLDPTNAAAVQGRDHVLVMMGRSPAPTNLANQVGADVRARQQEIAYQVQSNLDQARAAIGQHDFGTAQTDLDRARLAANADPSIFTPEALRNFRNQIDQVELQLHQTQEQVQQQQSALTAQQIQNRIQAEHERAIVARQKTVADLIRTSQTLTNQGRYKEALQTVEQILILDPTNDYAVGVQPLLQDKTQFAQQRQYMEMRGRMVTDQYNAAQEKMIPYADILRYPTDWPDISATRDQTVAAERGGQGAGGRAVEAQLDRVLPEVSFDAVGFSDVVDFLRDVSGANLFVNWKAMEAAGIDRNTPVTARLHNVKFSKALSLILDSVGGGQTKLGYTIDEGVITISTADDLSKNVVVQVYDIRDLIIDVPDFTDAPTFQLSNQNQSSGGGSQGIGQGGGSGQTTVTNQLFGNGQQNQQQSQGPTRQDLVDAITKLIEDTVSTDSWKDNGGSVGALRELQGQLIVTQTPENHRQLVNLLEQLREERAIQVTIETRFLTVQRNFLEDVGVDLNMLFNLNSSWSKNFGTIPLAGPNSTFVQNPVTSVPGSIGSGSITPVGLTSGFTYLDDFQVQLLLRAVQASVTSTTLQAPRITLFNGQRAWVLVATQQAYISNLVPVVSTGISAFSPVPATVQSGVLLDVQATVSADRKYVTLTLRPQLSTLLSLAPFTFQTGTSGAANTGGVFGFSTASPSATVQLPEIAITEVRTTVSVPDGGTLLLGGQTIAGDTVREIGVPILSKIPFLKRAFTSQSLAKDEQVLLILVRPTIIMQREIEQKQFPLLTSKLGNGG